jgi:hypothetical protein
MTACRTLNWGFLGVWNGIAVFFAVRAMQSGSRAIREHMLGGEQRSQEQRLLELGEGPEVFAGVGQGAAPPGDDDDPSSSAVDATYNPSSGESDDEPNFHPDNSSSSSQQPGDLAQGSIPITEFRRQ